MSIKVSAWVWENYHGTPSKKLLMLALADFCDDTGVCYPGVARIAALAEMNERNCRKAIADLEAGGDVLREIGTGIMTDHGQTNRYYLVQFRQAMGLEGSMRSAAKNKAGGSVATPDGGSVATPDGGSVATPDGGSVATPKPSVEPSDIKPIARERAGADENKKPRPRNPVWDAVCTHLFDGSQREAARISILAHWIEGKTSGSRNINVGPNAQPGNADDVQAFVAYWRNQHPGIHLPLDIGKFARAWDQWRAQPAPVKTALDKLADSLRAWQAEQDAEAAQHELR
jgi:hypothetical protein